MKPDEMLTPNAVAAMIKVDVETIRRMVRRRQLPAFQIGRMLRLSERDVLAFLSRCRTHVAPCVQKQAQKGPFGGIRTSDSIGPKS